MTTVFFIRHAEPNYSNHDDAQRELTEKGLADRKLVTKFLSDKSIDVVFSSPYKRSVDTIKDFTDRYGMEIETIFDFRERKVDSVWIEDFNSFSRRQWNDFSYKLADGEALAEVQQRNVRALMLILEQYRDKNIVVGSHGTALSLIINYFYPDFGYKDFERIKSLMPWIVQFTFDNTKLLSIDTFDVFA